MIIYIKYNKQSLRLQEKQIQIGRSKKNDMIINDKYVSREHCRIRIKDHSIQIEDLDSSNGTYVATESGDILKIARVGEFVTDTEKMPNRIYIGNSDLAISTREAEIGLPPPQKTMVYKPQRQKKPVSRPYQKIILDEQNVHSIGKINPEVGAVAIRRLLEEFLYSYTHVDSDLYELIDTVSIEKNITREMINMMHYIRVTGNNGAHRGHRVSPNSLQKAIHNFQKIKHALSNKVN